MKNVRTFFVVTLIVIFGSITVFAQTTTPCGGIEKAVQLAGLDCKNVGFVTTKTIEENLTNGNLKNISETKKAELRAASSHDVFSIGSRLYVNVDRLVGKKDMTDIATTLIVANAIAHGKTTIQAEKLGLQFAQKHQPMVAQTQNRTSEPANILDVRATQENMGSGTKGIKSPN